MEILSGSRPVAGSPYLHAAYLSAYTRRERPDGKSDLVLKEEPPKPAKLSTEPPKPPESWSVPYSPEAQPLTPLVTSTLPAPQSSTSDFPVAAGLHLSLFLGALFLIMLGLALRALTGRTRLVYVRHRRFHGWRRASRSPESVRPLTLHDPSWQGIMPVRPPGGYL